MVILGVQKMINKISNPCYRCGSQRIIAKNYKEGTGINQVDVTLTVCPNPECQKTVDKELKAVHQRTIMMTKKKEERLTARKNRKRI